MFNKACVSVVALMLCLSPVSSWAGERVEGIVTDASGDPLRGVMVSAISDDRQKSISVFSGEDGRFEIENIGSGIDRVRARSIEFEDTFEEQSSQREPSWAARCRCSSSPVNQVSSSSKTRSQRVGSSA